MDVFFAYSHPMLDFLRGEKGALKEAPQIPLCPLEQGLHIH